MSDTVDCQCPACTGDETIECAVCGVELATGCYFELEYPGDREAGAESNPGYTADVLCDQHAAAVRKFIDRLETPEEVTAGDRGVIHGIVVDEGVATMPTIYDRYTAAVQQPVTERTVRNWLADLVGAGLVEAVGENRGRKYRYTNEQPRVD
ncbi:hypothetical protein [Halovivax cerinus]|uniref:Uncharacterized protein n=1 Tax=Halovivax cerinus TaxID=1487865 RepID=A0ABD5NKT4_9EURY|nr:hypothetical protein [Halovivax cerinus]